MNKIFYSINTEFDVHVPFHILKVYGDNAWNFLLSNKRSYCTCLSIVYLAITKHLHLFSISTTFLFLFQTHNFRKFLYNELSKFLLLYVDFTEQ
jgi:hypothetical protein